MKKSNRILKSVAFLGVATLFIVGPTAKASDESAKEYLTVEEYIVMARPYLHLSCEGAWNEANQEADPYIEIVNKISAIGFINHELDIEEVNAQPAEEVEALSIAFYNHIGRLCRDNPNNLLAGVVERALLYAFYKVTPEAVDE